VGHEAYGQVRGHYRNKGTQGVNQEQAQFQQFSCPQALHSIKINATFSEQGL
jgi:hypothetical protein